MITNERLKEIERLACGATKGDWVYMRDPVGIDRTLVVAPNNEIVAYLKDRVADTAYIASLSPETVKDMVRELIAGRSLIDELVVELKKYKSLPSYSGAYTEQKLDRARAHRKEFGGE